MIGSKANILFRAQGKAALYDLIQKWVNIASPRTHVFVRCNNGHYDGVVLSEDPDPQSMPREYTYFKPSYFGIERQYRVPQHRKPSCLR